MTDYRVSAVEFTQTHFNTKKIAISSPLIDTKLLQAKQRIKVFTPFQ